MARCLTSTLLAVAVADPRAFVLGFAYYTVFAGQLAAVSPAAAAATQPPPWKLGVELLRSLVARRRRRGPRRRRSPSTTGRRPALGLVLWVGFPLVLWTGALLHETRPGASPPSTPATGCVKLLVVGVIVSAWG